jgi:hypothetical protein
MPRERDEIAVLLRRIDLAALADELLDGRGHNNMWRCPTHEGQTGLTPPVSVFSGDDGVPRWHCHSCGDGGTAIALLLRSGAAANSPDAIEQLAARAHVAPPTTTPAPRRELRERRWWELDLFSYVKVCAARLHTPEAAGPRKWLTDTRAIPDDVIDAAVIGFDPGARALPRQDGIPRTPAIVVPIREPAEQPPGWTVTYTLHRVLGPSRSRWRSPVSQLARNPGVGFFDPPQRTRSALMVTEGPMDALSALAAGYRAAAVLGTGTPNARLADRLARTGEHLILAFDNDPAGREATDRLSGLLRARGAPHSLLHIPARFGDLNEWHTQCRDQWRHVLGGEAQRAASGWNRQRPKVRLPPAGVT